MVTPRGRRAGYTVTELMLVVAIIGILASMSARILLQVNRFFILTNTKNEIQGEARGIMYIVSRELHQAQSSTIVIDRFNASQPFYSRITFTKIQGGNSVSYYQNGTQFIQSVGASSQTLSKNVQYMSFTFPRSDDMTIVSFALTLQKSIYEGRVKALHMASERIQVMN
ncbi:MAG: prepilin-type N-terminal cleavage/methylation domain-containing protein [Elusimicrobia bacterium]|nr:prepilin-type N-terminal cleavage/methylation domain-containing protein [Elusimicrobiota bacterium]